jgi:hypothetical protein
VQKPSDVVAGRRYVVTEPASKPAAKPTPTVASRSVDQALFADRTCEVGLDFVRQERAFNDMIRPSLLPNRMNTLGGGFACGDVNGDGHDDVFFGGAAGQVRALCLTHTACPGLREIGMVTAALWTDADADGSSRVAELHAGSGYLAQSSPVAFFSHPVDVSPVGIDVRWPDGRLTRHAAGEKDTHLLVARPD